MSESDNRHMPADAIWSWRPAVNTGNYVKAMVLLPGLLVVGGAIGGGAVGAVVLGAIGLVFTGAIVGFLHHRDTHTWVTVLPDGCMTSRVGRAHVEVDLRAKPTAHAIHVVHKVASSGRGGSRTGGSRTEYTLVGTGDLPTFEPVAGGHRDSLGVRVEGGMRVPADADDGLIEAMSRFTEVRVLAGELVEREAKRVIVSGYPIRPAATGEPESPTA